MKMKQTSLMKVTGIGAAYLSLLLPGCTSPVEQEQRPNVIFLLIDDQRNTSLGCAGHPIIKTPVIDDLANEGVRFSNAFVTTSICAASRASIFTGMHERTHQFTFGTKPLSKDYLDNSYSVLLGNA